MPLTFRRFTESDYAAFAGAAELPDGAPLIAEINSEMCAVIGGDPDLEEQVLLEVFHLDPETWTQRSWMIELKSVKEAIKLAVTLNKKGLLELDKVEAMAEAGNMGWMRCI